MPYYQVTHINLYSDWITIIKSELQNKGYQIDNLDDDTIVYSYFSLKKRLIKPAKRKILKSDVFVCPTDLMNALTLIESKIINGDDLLPHLSRKLNNIREKDGLLFDWGIHHLHLGTVMESNGFINRSGPLLYAIFDSENAYFINVLNHGEWTAQELIKTIHRNWPSSIENFKLKDVIDVQHHFSDRDISKLRGNNMNVVIEVEDGAVYMGPGGGLTASGDSLDAQFDSLKVMLNFEDLQNRIKDDIEKVLNEAHIDISIITNNNFNFKLKKHQDQFYIEELNNNFNISISGI